MRASTPARSNLLVRTMASYVLESGPLENVVVREGTVVSRPAPGSKNSEQHPAVCGSDLAVVYFKEGPRRAAVQERERELRPPLV